MFIVRARVAAGLSQRALADATGISQPLLRIISGDRIVKMPDVVAISWATGHTVAQLTGTGTVADRAPAHRPAAGRLEMTWQRKIHSTEGLIHHSDRDGLGRTCRSAAGSGWPRSA